MELKTVLKLIGAGVTGGYLALRISKPRRSYNEFVEIYNSLSTDFLNQLETVFLQTLLPALPESARDSLDALLDRQPNFHEQLRFFQTHLENFDELVMKAMSRFCLLKEQGAFPGSASRKVSRVDQQTVSVAVERLYADLEEAFLDALSRNLPDEKKDEYYSKLDNDSPLKLRLTRFCEMSPHLGGVVFDALAKFENLTHQIEG